MLQHTKKNKRIQLSRPDFTTVSADKSAKRLTSAHFSITLSNKGIGTAVVVSKKVAKSAVQRHLIKRRVREAIATHNKSSSVTNTQSAAIIVYARAGTATLPYSEILTEISAMLTSAK